MLLIINVFFTVEYYVADYKRIFLQLNNMCLVIFYSDQHIYRSTSRKAIRTGNNISYLDMLFTIAYRILL